MEKQSDENKKNPADNNQPTHRIKLKMPNLPRAFRFPI